MEETLGRLSKKAGVKATMVLDRSTGAILRTSGNVSSIRVPKPIQPSSSSGSSSLLPSQMAVSLGALGDDVNNGLPPLPDENQVAEELASLVWNFVGRAGGLVQELDGEVRYSSCFSPLSQRLSTLR